MLLKIGDKAPDFKSKTHNMEDFVLSSYFGKENIVLFFFPLVNTPTCFNELCSLRDDYKAYEKLNAKVFALSVDSPFSQKLWSEKEKFNFPMITDFNKEISKLYGCQYDDLIGFKGVAKRSAFVIDKNGIIKYIWISEDSGVIPNFKEIQDTLSKI
jgi:glutaredoxin-dependent peroxiredoxin